MASPRTLPRSARFTSSTTSRYGPDVGVARRLEEPSLLDAKTQLLAVNLRRETDDEVLVSDGWMELDRLAARAKEVALDDLRHPRLSGSRWPLQHHETTPFQEVCERRPA